MIDELKNCQDIYDLADLLEIPAKILTYLLYVLPDAKKYTEFCISKKNGSKRIIHAPEDRLKRLQRSLSEVLYQCSTDITKTHKPTRSYGFEKGLGIYDNASCHTGRHWVFNIDIKDFFSTINFGRVISFFKKSNDFGLNPKIATYIAQIACFQNSLPQGAPSSPVISNLICGSLDFRLSKIASKFRCNYSRYADDITFSTNLKNFPTELAQQDADTGQWLLSELMKDVLARAGFEENPLKTRMSYRSNRQVVTGLVCNQFPSPPREFYKYARAAVYSMVSGKKPHISNFCEPDRDNCSNTDHPTKSNDEIFLIIEGRIGYCFDIHDRNDKRIDKKKFFDPTSLRKTYADLLRLKYFVNSTNAIVLTEGPSDLLYIKAAIKQANAPIEHVLDIAADGSPQSLVDFYKFRNRPSSILGISGGSGNLGLFLERHHDFLNRLSPALTPRPVIILLDNDKGLKGISEKVSTLFKTDIAIDKNKTFYDLKRNLFIVKTPHLQAKQMSCVEEFLDPEALGVTIDGKTFNGTDDFDSAKYFGKVILSHHVYENRQLYDFSGIYRILARVSSAVDAAL